MGNNWAVMSGTWRDQLGAIRRLQDRPARTLAAGYGIVVDGDNQPIRLLRRSLQVSHVADVQQIEAAVGERDRQPAAAIRLGLRSQLPAPAG